jgi:deazaflavin-dependent oxidoreductase (nitroreductase family)
MVLVTMTGRRTGAARTVPLAAVRHDRSWLLVASNAGKARMPAWVHNLRAHPSVRVEHRAESRLHHAREAVGEELAALWPRVVEAYPGYAVYRDRTTRTIPLFVLDPVEVPA